MENQNDERRNKSVQRRDEFAAKIAAIDANPDYRLFLRCQALVKERGEHAEKFTVENYNVKLIDDAALAKRIAAADPRIDEAIRWARSERDRTSKELSTRGHVEKNIFGSVTSFLESNEPKITKHLESIDVVIRELEALKLAPTKDLGIEIKKIQSNVLMLNTTTEKIPCAPGFAAALSRE